MKKFFLFNSILCLMVFSCNLDTEEGQLIDQNGNNDAITEEEAPQGELLNVGNQNMRFSIFEVVSIDISGEQFSEGIEEGTLSDGSKLDLFLSQGNLSFVVPKLNQGKYTLQFSQSSRLFDLEFEVKPHDLKGDPKTYLQHMEVVSKASFEALESNVTFLSKEDQTKLTQDIQNLKIFSEEHWAKAALLTEEELVDLAFFVEANRGWIEELNAAVNELNAINLNSRLSNEVSNYEQRAYEISKAFVKSIIIVVGKIPTILASTGTGFLAGGPLGAAVGLGISIGFLLPDILNVFSTLDRVGDEILVVSDSELGVNWMTDFAFDNNESNELSIMREYRTLYAGDKNSTYPFIQELISSTDLLFENWKKLKNKLMVEIGYESRSFSELPSFTNKNLRVHSDHLSVSGISNAKVSSSEKKEAGKFFITFSTTEKESQDFDFSIFYDNQFFDKIEKKVSATLEVEEETAEDIEIVSGNEQSGRQGEQLNEPLVVVVKDNEGNVVSGQEVIFRLASGGGSLSQEKVISDSNGNAQTNWTLGDNSDPQIVEALIMNNMGEVIDSVNFSATATNECTDNEPPTITGLSYTCKKHFNDPADQITFYVNIDFINENENLNFDDYTIIVTNANGGGYDQKLISGTMEAGSLQVAVAGLKTALWSCSPTGGSSMILKQGEVYLIDPCGNESNRLNYQAVIYSLNKD
jgi:hypothetical protein